MARQELQIRIVDRDDNSTPRPLHPPDPQQPQDPEPARPYPFNDPLAVPHQPGRPLPEPMTALRISTRSATHGAQRASTSVPRQPGRPLPEPMPGFEDEYEVNCSP